MLNFFRNRTNNPNTLVGLFLLMVLALFAGPNVLPRLLSEFIEGAYEGVPCAWLRPAESRDQHQSMIARAAAEEEAPVRVSISTGSFPTEPTDTLSVHIIVTNDTIGAVPIVVPPQIITNDTGASGIGVVFNSTAPVSPGNAGQPVPENQIRLLGPRQSCVQKLEYAFESLAAVGINPNTLVKAYYRSTTQGTVPVSTESIYQDAGLWVGVVESAPTTLSSDIQAGGGIGTNP